MKKCCNISIESLENIVVFDNFYFNIFQLNMDFVIFRQFSTF